MSNFDALPVAPSRYPLLYDSTMIYTQSRLNEHLQSYYDQVARMPPKRLVKQRERVLKLMRFIFPRMKTFAAKSGLRLKQPVLSGSVHDKLETKCAHVFDLLFPFDKDKSRISSVEPGYAVIPLRKPKKTDAVDLWRYGRSMDGLYLSPLQVTNLVHKLLGKVISVPVKIPNVELEPLFDENNHPRIQLRLSLDVQINIIPAIIPINAENPTLVTRPYTYDQNPASDMLWRLHYGDKEHAIVTLMDKADRGCRKEAFRIIKTLLMKEPTFKGLTSYHLKTVLLHNFDSDVDNYACWQRESLELCVLSLLRDLLDCITRRQLPHFFEGEYNLLELVPDRTIHTLRGRLSYIINNENEFIRILRKRDPNVQYKTKKAERKSDVAALSLNDVLQKYRKTAAQSLQITVLSHRQSQDSALPPLNRTDPIVHEISDHSLDSVDVSLPDVNGTLSKTNTSTFDDHNSGKFETPWERTSSQASVSQI